MAQTQRTLNTIWNLLADNFTNDIDAVDVRDGFDSVRGRVGCLYVANGSGATVAIASAGTFYEVITPSWNLAADSVGFSQAGPGRMQYDGAVAALAVITCTFSMSKSGGGSDDISMRFGVDGVTDARYEIIRNVSGTSDVGAGAISGTIQLDPGEYVSLWVANNNDTSDVDIEAAQIQAVTIPL